ncbi:hypothetical protein BU17DRAFT_85937 [Hysterangium stoloniferum]|nr:hypothetical protein BU17DRAFT_85937 [Hysterangium stoloniferum]
MHGDKMWLRDFLPSDLPLARILSFGYDGYTKDRDQFSTETLNGHAQNLLCRLELKRVGIEDRPIIFIAHNVGGIILKSALIFGSNCHKGHLYGYWQVYEATRGIIYLGTPHQGTPYNYLDIALNESGRNDKLVKHLTVNSEWLQRQLAYDLPILAQKEISITYVYEGLGTYGKEVVGKHSAVLPGVVDVHPIGLPRSHEMLTKFESKEGDYEVISGTLKKMAGLKTMQSEKTQIPSPPPPPIPSDPVLISDSLRFRMSYIPQLLR